MNLTNLRGTSSSLKYFNVGQLSASKFRDGDCVALCFYYKAKLDICQAWKKKFGAIDILNNWINN